MILGSILASPALAQTEPAALEQRIRQTLDSLDAKTAFYAKHLPSGREIAIRADVPVNTLSIIKIPILVLAYRDAAAGKLDLDARYRLRPEDQRRGTGILQTFAPGLEPTYRDLVTQMIISSDNTATDIMIETLGFDRVNQLLDTLRLPNTRLLNTNARLFRVVWQLVEPAAADWTDRQVFERGLPDQPGLEEKYLAYEADPANWLGQTTAREISRLLEQIHNGEVASRAHCDAMIETLTRQLYDSRLPHHIKLRARVAHKTGDWVPIAGNDAGIILAPSGPIVVAVFATQNRGSFYELEEAEGRIAEMLLDQWGETAPDPE